MELLSGGSHAGYCAPGKPGFVLLTWPKHSNNCWKERIVDPDGCSDPSMRGARRQCRLCADGIEQSRWV